MINSISLIAGKTRIARPVTFGANKQYESAMNRFEKGEKLNINCCGNREVSLDGQKLNFLA